MDRDLPRLRCTGRRRRSRDVESGAPFCRGARAFYLTIVTMVLALGRQPPFLRSVGSSPAETHTLLQYVIKSHHTRYQPFDPLSEVRFYTPSCEKVQLFKSVEARFSRESEKPFTCLRKVRRARAIDGEAIKGLGLGIPLWGVVDRETIKSVGKRVCLYQLIQLGLEPRGIGLIQILVALRRLIKRIFVRALDRIEAMLPARDPSPFGAGVHPRLRRPLWKDRRRRTATSTGFCWNPGVQAGSCYTTASLDPPVSRIGLPPSTRLRTERRHAALALTAMEHAILPTSPPRDWLSPALNYLLRLVPIRRSARPEVRSCFPGIDWAPSARYVRSACRLRASQCRHSIPGVGRGECPRSAPLEDPTCLRSIRSTHGELLRHAPLEGPGSSCSCLLEKKHLSSRPMVGVAGWTVLLASGVVASPAALLTMLSIPADPITPVDAASGSTERSRKAGPARFRPFPSPSRLEGLDVFSTALCHCRPGRL